MNDYLVLCIEHAEILRQLGLHYDFSRFPRAVLGVFIPTFFELCNLESFGHKREPTRFDQDLLLLLKLFLRLCRIRYQEGLVMEPAKVWV